MCYDKNVFVSTTDDDAAAAAAATERQRRLAHVAGLG
jgi:hypothetical protein